MCDGRAGRALGLCPVPTTSGRPSPLRLRRDHSRYLGSGFRHYRRSGFYPAPQNRLTHDCLCAKHSVVSLWFRDEQCVEFCVSNGIWVQSAKTRAAETLFMECLLKRAREFLW
jgi:hypothetical protein